MINRPPERPLMEPLPHLAFAHTEDGVRMLLERWPDRSVFSTRLLDSLTRNQRPDSPYCLSGHVEELTPSFPLMVWDSITFICVHGTVTYDLLPQDAHDYQTDTWRGVLRSEEALR